MYSSVHFLEGFRGNFVYGCTQVVIHRLEIIVWILWPKGPSLLVECCGHKWGGHCVCIHRQKFIFFKTIVFIEIIFGLVPSLKENFVAGEFISKDVFVGFLLFQTVGKFGASLWSSKFSFSTSEI